jgi:hypothetical protein
MLRWQGLFVFFVFYLIPPLHAAGADNGSSTAARQVECAVAESMPTKGPMRSFRAREVGVCQTSCRCPLPSEQERRRIVEISSRSANNENARTDDAANNGDTRVKILHDLLILLR